MDTFDELLQCLAESLQHENKMYSTFPSMLTVTDFDSCSPPAHYPKVLVSPQQEVLVGQCLYYHHSILTASKSVE